MPFYRLPAEGMAQTRGVSSHLKIRIKGRATNFKLSKTPSQVCPPLLDFSSFQMESSWQPRMATTGGHSASELYTRLHISDVFNVIGVSSPRSVCIVVSAEFSMPVFPVLHVNAFVWSLLDPPPPPLNSSIPVTLPSNNCSLLFTCCL